MEVFERLKAADRTDRKFFKDDTQYYTDVEIELSEAKREIEREKKKAV
jgi:hypothetical protein